MYVCNTEKDTWEVRAGLPIPHDRKLAEIVLWADCWTIQEFDYESPTERLVARGVVWCFIREEEIRRGIEESLKAWSYATPVSNIRPKETLQYELVNWTSKDFEKEDLPVWLL